LFGQLTYYAYLVVYDHVDASLSTIKYQRDEHILDEGHPEAPRQ
jgi:hypothetical protein